MVVEVNINVFVNLNFRLVVGRDSEIMIFYLYSLKYNNYKIYI